MRALKIRELITLCCLALIATSSGCKQDCAQWKVAAAINEDKDGNSEAAIELLQTAVQMDPDSAGIKLRLANLLAKNDQGDLGLTLCDEVIESDPSVKQAWLIRSNCLLMLGRFKAALADFQKYGSDVIDKDCWELNELAYCRGLAGVELDRALRQVNEGIAKFETQQRWGHFTKVPLPISALVSACLISRHTDRGHLLVLDLLSDLIFEEQQVWLEMNADLKQLQDDHAEKNEAESDPEIKELRAKVQQKEAERDADKLQAVARGLAVLLATRSLIFEDQGQSRLADLDRLWLERIGFKPKEIYDALPNEVECFEALKASEFMLDTRGFLLTELPWQPTWTDGVGKIIQLQDRNTSLTSHDVFLARHDFRLLIELKRKKTSLISYGSYRRALRDLDIVVAASEVHLLALSSDVANRIDFPVKGLRGHKIVRDSKDISKMKAVEARMVAALRNHRLQAHVKANQMDAAHKDMVRIKELGFEPGPDLF